MCIGVKYGQSRQGYVVTLKQLELGQQFCGLSGLLLVYFLIIILSVRLCDAPGEGGGDGELDDSGLIYLVRVRQYFGDRRRFFLFICVMLRVTMTLNLRVRGDGDGEGEVHYLVPVWSVRVRYTLMTNTVLHSRSPATMMNVCNTTFNTVYPSLQLNLVSFKIIIEFFSLMRECARTYSHLIRQQSVSLYSVNTSTLPPLDAQRQRFIVGFGRTRLLCAHRHRW